MGNKYLLGNARNMKISKRKNKSQEKSNLKRAAWTKKKSVKDRVDTNYVFEAFKVCAERLKRLNADEQNEVAQLLMQENLLGGIC